MTKPDKRGRAASTSKPPAKRSLSQSSTEKETPTPKKKVTTTSKQNPPSTPSPTVATRKKAPPSTPTPATPTTPSKRSSPSTKGKSALPVKSKPTSTSTKTPKTNPKTIGKPKQQASSKKHDTKEGDNQPNVSGAVFQNLATNSVNDKETLKQTIRAFVEREFFTHVKFIIKNKKMAYYDRHANPSTYCAIITKGCGIPETYDAAQWWETLAKQTVRRKVSQLRGDRMTALKWEYYGK